jgi:hypothetical protein
MEKYLVEFTLMANITRILVRDPEENYVSRRGKIVSQRVLQFMFVSTSNLNSP